jgi:triosephosphate isomerase
MARRPMVAGNWKMHLRVDEAVDLVDGLDRQVDSFTGVDVVVCPPYVDIPGVAARLANSPIQVGAQNMHWEQSGAFTGEISAEMLRGLCEYVIVGHSERRAMFGDTDETVNQKLQAALKASLRAIMCVGETLEQNEAGQTADVVSRQVRAGLAGLSAEALSDAVIAYEPIWAIGTGRAATAGGANDVIKVIIRPAVEHLFGSEVAGSLRVLYGGSVKPANARELFEQPDIDGGLVGGASLKADDFAEIIRAAV